MRKEKTQISKIRTTKGKITANTKEIQKYKWEDNSKHQGNSEIQMGR
jgi:hypothetical protein